MGAMTLPSGLGRRVRRAWGGVPLPIPLWNDRVLLNAGNAQKGQFLATKMNRVMLDCYWKGPDL